ncbi:MAG: hypothetical protein KZQ70_12315, partial [gamma proteobacterium symbiont of Lucinoma myriamae]|nr:hypothetical protein [gamma proteobacterium symbiont of Lucinoma myriamae]
MPEQCFFKKENVNLIEFSSSQITKTNKSEDILHTADSYIEHSQFETALNYMRNHLEHEQDNIELTIKLISLYKALRNRNEFDKAYERFSSNGVTVRYWNDG